MTARAFAIMLAAVLLLPVAGCQRAVELGYAAPPGVLAEKLSIGQVAVLDERSIPPDKAGAVMGIDGRPLKVLTVAPDMADAVRRAFIAALAARHALAADPAQARYDLQVRLVELQGLQFVDRQAQVDIVVQLVDRANGREVYTGRIFAEQRGDDFLMLDYQFSAPPSALGVITERTLDEAIDHALDRAGLALAAAR
jgi:hypothetical protein